MANCTIRGWSFLRALLLGAATLGLMGAPATAQVGVTSAADGDPLGKPPTQNERVLRIGTNVQANELVTTGSSDRAHLVFLDGTSVTIGPNAQLTIDKFVYDPGTKTGELAFTAAKGVFRLVGGKISKTGAITVKTPSSTIGIRGGITILKVTLSETMAAFIFGAKLTVTAAGQTQTITRPGYQIIAAAGRPLGAPTAIPKGGLTLDIAVLETGSTRNSNPGGSNADQRVQTSGFSNQNSGQAGNLFNNRQAQFYSYANAATNNQATNAVSNSNTQTQVNNASPPPPPPPPSPGPPTTQTFSGFASGLVTAVNDGPGTPQTPVLGGPSDVSIVTNTSTNLVTGTLVLRQADTSVTTFQLGGTPSSSAFLNDKAYVMVTTDDQARPTTVQVNGNTFTVQASTALFTSGFPQQSGPFGSCTCEFLSWGQWVSVISYPNNYRPGEFDIINSTPYIAGTLTTALQMPQTGSATYNGSMMGNVWNAGNTYGATGTYNSTWSFANRSGSFNASFDGTTYGGKATAVLGSGGTTFAGTISGGGNYGSLSGAFFAAPGDVAKYQAGSFAIGANSQTYKAAGVFAGQR
jgi:FecR protein